MTNDQYIRQLPRRQFAEQLIKEVAEPDYDEGLDGEMYECGTYTFFITSDGERFWEDYESAIEHECWWLAQQHSEEAS